MYGLLTYILQKNPSTIRQPEEDRGRENYTMTGWVEIERSTPISRHIQALCSEANNSTYVRDVDLKAWSELPGKFIAITKIFSLLFFLFFSFSLSYSCHTPDDIENTKKKKYLGTKLV